LILTGVARFLMELIRINPRPFFRNVQRTGCERGVGIAGIGVARDFAAQTNDLG